MNKKERKFVDLKKENSDYHNEITLRNITNPITVLLGPNGTGKTTSLRLMEEKLKRKKMKCISYRTTSNKESYICQGGPFALASIFHSEGERMDETFYSWMNSVFLKAVLEDKEDLYILIDEIDSGTSFDKLYQQIKDLLFITMKELEKGRNIYLIIAANSYEVVDLVRCKTTELIWLPSRQKIKVPNYNSFKKRYMEYYEAMKKEN